MNYKYLFLFFLVSLSSCSSFMYSNRTANNTINVRSNVNNFSVNFPQVKGQYRSSLNASDGHLTYVLPELKNSFTSMVVSSNNYESQKIEISKSVRIVPVLMDLTLSLFTFGIPIIVDPFKSDFYKISENSQTINVDFVYKQSYMTSEFNKIKYSSNPDLFENFLKEYPNYEKLELVINTKDSIEFSHALKQNSEIAITQFVKTHPSSIYTTKGSKIESEFITNRKDFNEAKIENSVSKYESFIAKHELAIQLTEAHVLLVEAAEKIALLSNNTNELIAYQNNYLNKFRNYLSNSNYEEKHTKIKSEIVTQINKDLSKVDYTAYILFWNNYKETSKNNINTNDVALYNSTYKTQISNLLFQNILKQENKKVQDSFVNINCNKFNGLYTQSLFIREVLDNSNNKSGKIKIFNEDYISHSCKPIQAGSSFKNIISSKYIYKNNSYQALDEVESQILNFQNNSLEGPQESNSNNEVKYKVVFKNKLPVNEEFLNHGKTIEMINYDAYGTVKYTYEFEGGVNLTLQKLDADIKTVDNIFSQRKIEEALEGYKKLLLNNYPAETKQNITLNSKLAVSQKAKDEKDRKAEMARLAEEKRQERLRAIEQQKEERARLAEENRQNKINNARNSNSLSSQGSYQSSQSESETCDECNGRGKIICSMCNGLGKRLEFETIWVDCGCKSYNENMILMGKEPDPYFGPRALCRKCDGTGRIKR